MKLLFENDRARRVQDRLAGNVPNLYKTRLPRLYGVLSAVRFKPLSRPSFQIKMPSAQFRVSRLFEFSNKTLCFMFHVVVLFHGLNKTILTATSPESGANRMQKTCINRAKEQSRMSQFIIKLDADATAELLGISGNSPEAKEAKIEFTKAMLVEFTKKYIKPLLNEDSIRRLFSSEVAAVSNAAAAEIKKLVEAEFGEYKKSGYGRQAFELNEPFKNKIVNEARAEYIKEIDRLVESAVAIQSEKTLQTVKDTVDKMVANSIGKRGNELFVRFVKDRVESYLEFEIEKLNEELKKEK